MGVININRVILTANLTRDPELRNTNSGTSVANLRIAVNTRTKNGATGEWTDKPNYFDVTVWGKQAENAARYLEKGSPVAVDGRLEWREWEDQNGNKRQSVEIVADSVQYLNSGGGGEGGNRDGGANAQPQSDVPADTSGFDTPVAVPGGDDDIPF